MLARHDYAQATEAYIVELALHRRAESVARDVRQRLQQESEQARQIMGDSRRSAEGMNARAYAPAAWDEADSSAASGEAAFAREVYTDATPSFERAYTAAYRHAEVWRARLFVFSRPRGLRRKRLGRRARWPVVAPPRREPLSTLPNSGSRPRVPRLRPPAHSNVETTRPREPFSLMRDACMARRRRRPAWRRRRKRAASMQWSRIPGGYSRPASSTHACTGSVTF